MIETEIKCKIGDCAQMRTRLLALGFQLSGHVTEEDFYFDNERSQIRTNGEALRIRVITDHDNGVSRTVITLKGKKLDTVSMSRQELETSVEDSETAIRILQGLGFSVVYPLVIKERHTYTFGRMTACLDQVKDLGDFLELEILAADEESYPKALEEIQHTLKKLGYTMSDTTKNSYLSMLQGITD